MRNGSFTISRYFANQNLKAIAKWFVPSALLIYVYYPAFAWMIERWLAPDSYYSHGFLIPFVSIYWILKKKSLLVATEKQTDVWGFAALVFGAFLQIVSSLLRIYFLSAFSLVIILLGGVHFLFGKKTLALVWFPISFLALMIPLPLLIISEVTLQMKFFVSEVAVWCLNSIGIHAVREGSYIQMLHSVLLVGDPCSGLRSFLAFLCLGFVFAYGTALAFWKRAVLVIAGFPLALLSNIGRVIFLGLVSEIYGMEFAKGWIHETSGIVAFLFAFVIFMLIRRKLETFSLIVGKKQ